MTSSPFAEPADTIVSDLPCFHCNYNLRSLNTSGDCPECGKPVEFTTKLWPEHFDLKAVTRLRKAASRIVCSSLIALAALGALLLAALLEGLFPFPIPAAVAILTCIFCSVYYLVGCFGLVDASSQLQGRRPQSLLVRICLPLLLLLSWLLLLGISMVGVTFVAASVSALIVWTSIYATPVVGATGKREIASLFEACTWIGLLLVCVGMIALLAVIADFFLPQPSGISPGEILLLAACALVAGGLHTIAMLWSSRWLKRATPAANYQIERERARK